jgi:hypothetical protein
MEQLDLSTSFLVPHKSHTGGNFSKENLSSSYGTLMSLLVYVFSPRHIFVLPSYPTSNGICGALGRIKDVAYLPCICCKVKAQIQGEKCYTLRSRCACVWNMVYENDSFI